LTSIPATRAIFQDHFIVLSFKFEFRQKSSAVHPLRKTAPW
jgi:hypothetical protein